MINIICVIRCVIFTDWRNIRKTSDLATWGSYWCHWKNTGLYTVVRVNSLRPSVNAKKNQLLNLFNMVANLPYQHKNTRARVVTKFWISQLDCWCRWPRLGKRPSLLKNGPAKLLAKIAKCRWWFLPAASFFWQDCMQKSWADGTFFLSFWHFTGSAQVWWERQYLQGIHSQC